MVAMKKQINWLVRTTCGDRTIADVDELFQNQEKKIGDTIDDKGSILLFFFWKKNIWWWIDYAVYMYNQNLF